MILVQLTTDDHYSISGLLASEMGYWEEREQDKGGLIGLATRWKDISSRFNPIAADEPTVLWSPFCPSCKMEMAMEENIPDQAGEMTVMWACDHCETVMELRVRHREGG